MKSSILFTCTLLLTSLFLGCSKEQSSDAPLEASELNAMVSTNDYHLKALDGTSYTVTKEANNYKLQGATQKVVLYDIFATWCPPCREAIPHLSALQEKYPDIKILGITIEDIDNKALKAFKEEHQGSYTFINSKDNRRLATSMASSLGVGQDFPIPFVIIYVDGNYFTHYNGTIASEMIEADIKRALEVK